MNADHARAAIRMVASAWPSPQMTDDEAKAWARRFAEVSFDEAAAALLELERTSKHRPAWADLWQIIVAERRRRTDAAVEAELPITSSDREAALVAAQRIRAQWADAHKIHVRRTPTSACMVCGAP